MLVRMICLPTSPDDIKAQLVKMGAPGAARIRVASKPAPSAVVYQLSGDDGFTVMGADAAGETIKTTSGRPLMLDQSYIP